MELHPGGLAAKEKAAAIRDRREQNGLCRQCGRPKPGDGGCPHCKEVRIAAGRNGYRPDIIEKRKRRGVCVVCCNPSDSGFKCSVCTIKHRIRQYGITYEQYMDMLVRQNNRCAICAGMFGGSKRDEPQVDHCHSTGMVRGLLCPLCNRAIGLLKDDPVRCESAADYLRSSLNDPLDLAVAA